MIAEPRRAGAAFVLADGGGHVRQSGEAEALLGDDDLTIGALTAAWLDVDAVTAAPDHCPCTGCAPGTG